MGTVDQQEETAYAVSAPVPSCAIWNFVDSQDEEGMSLLSIADWLKFVVGRSTVDETVLTRIVTKILLRAHWADSLCQAMFDGWVWSHEKRMDKVYQLELGTS